MRLFLYPLSSFAPILYDQGGVISSDPVLSKHTFMSGDIYDVGRVFQTLRKCEGAVLYFDTPLGAPQDMCWMGLVYALQNLGLPAHALFRHDCVILEKNVTLPGSTMDAAKFYKDVFCSASVNVENIFEGLSTLLDESSPGVFLNSFTQMSRSRPATMTSKYDGVCTICRGMYSKGQTIVWSRAMGAAHPDCHARKTNTTLPADLLTSINETLRQQLSKLESQVVQLTAAVRATQNPPTSE